MFLEQCQMNLRIRCGELAPLFVARSSNGTRFGLGNMGGRYILLTFVAGVTHPVEQRLLAGLRQSPGLFDDAESMMFIVSADPDDEHQSRARTRVPGIRAFFDSEQAIANLFGVEYVVGRPVSYLLSPRQQVFGIVLAGDPEQQVNTIRGAFKNSTPVECIHERFGTAPILIIPDVLDRSFCNELIDYYRTRGGVQSGFMIEVNGETVGHHDTRQKVRKDVTLVDPLMIRIINGSFHHLVIPQLARAFQY